MHIETINEILTDAVSKASKIATKNPQIPLLEYILLEMIDKSTLRVTGYNLDTYYTQDVFVKSKSDSSGKVSICVQGNLLLSYLGLFEKNEKVTLNISEKKIQVSIQDQQSSIHCVGAVEYPKNPINDLDGDQGV